MINKNVVLNCCEGVETCQVEENTVVMLNDTTIVLNRTAQILFNMLDGVQTISDIITKFISQIKGNVDKNEVHQDCLDCYENMLKNGIVNIVTFKENSHNIL